jgi:cell division septation protein DedD
VPETKALAASPSGIEKIDLDEKKTRPQTLTPPPRSYPYSLYLGSYLTLERAKKAISMYSKNGLSPYHVKVELGPKGVWYRVFAGFFEDRKKAKEFQQEHGLKKAEVKKTAYAILIRACPSGDGPDNEIQSIRDLGYFPYLMPGYDGKSRLLVGAYLTKAGAERHCQRLKSKGIQGEVLLR